jgi:hypothetical protein
MMIGALKMIHTLSIWLLVAAFLGAGLFNVIGTPATKTDFARWGGHHCGWGFDRSTPPRFFASCATGCLCRLDCLCSDLDLSAGTIDEAAA